MKETRKKLYYRIEVFDEQGERAGEYSGDNDLRPRTLSILLVAFPAVKAILLALSSLFGVLMGLLIDSLLKLG